MPAGKELTVQQLVEFRLFDDAFEKYKEQRRVAKELDEQADRLLDRLNEKRKDLQREIDKKQKKIKELQEELERLKDESDDHCRRVAAFLTGADPGAESPYDARTALIVGLRNEVMEQAVLLILKVLADDDDDSDD